MMNKQFLNGEWCEALSLQTLDVLNPANQSVVAKVPFANQDDCQLAIEKAHLAFKTWSKTTPYQRAEILKLTAEIIRKNIDDWAILMVKESGKPLLEAKGEWRVAANLFEWYAEEAKRGIGKVLPTIRVDKRSSVIYQPIGVVGVITAWNFPAYNPARAWAASMAAGCTVVAKPANETPLTAFKMAEALQQAGLPKGVLHVLTGDSNAIGNKMLAHPLLRKISFTGSTQVGELLMNGAAQTHTKLALELGGNAPVIIFKDVNVQELAKSAVAGKFRNNGQVCIAPQRFYVHEAIAPAFIKAFVEHTQALIVGDGMDEHTNLGPIINSKQYQHILILIDTAKREGSKLLTGGQTLDINKGYFVQPTVFLTQHDSVLMHQEIFGPIVPIATFNDQDDVVALANNTPYGLASYLFTNDLNTAVRTAEGLEFGMVGVNEWTPHGTELPFGGWKHSGIGHESGTEGLYEYLEAKLISIGGI